MQINAKIFVAETQSQHSVFPQINSLKTVCHPDSSNQILAALPLQYALAPSLTRDKLIPESNDKDNNIMKFTMKRPIYQL
jgi:hypothetical protein